MAGATGTLALVIKTAQSDEWVAAFAIAMTAAPAYGMLALAIIRTHTHSARRPDRAYVVDTVKSPTRRVMTNDSERSRRVRLRTLRRVLLGDQSMSGGCQLSSTLNRPLRQFECSFNEPKQVGFRKVVYQSEFISEICYSLRISTRPGILLSRIRHRWGSLRFPSA